MIRVELYEYTAAIYSSVTHSSGTQLTHHTPHVFTRQRRHRVINSRTKHGGTGAATATATAQQAAAAARRRAGWHGAIMVAVMTYHVLALLGVALNLTEFKRTNQLILSALVFCLWR